MGEPSVARDDHLHEQRSPQWRGEGIEGVSDPFLAARDMGRSFCIFFGSVLGGDGRIQLSSLRNEGIDGNCESTRIHREEPICLFCVHIMYVVESEND